MKIFTKINLQINKASNREIEILKYRYKNITTEIQIPQIQKTHTFKLHITKKYSKNWMNIGQWISINYWADYILWRQISIFDSILFSSRSNVIENSN